MIRFRLIVSISIIIISRISISFRVRNTLEYILILLIIMALISLIMSSTLLELLLARMISSSSSVTSIAFIKSDQELSELVVVVR